MPSEVWWHCRGACRRKIKVSDRDVSPFCLKDSRFMVLLYMPPETLVPENVVPTPLAQGKSSQ